MSQINLATSVSRTIQPSTTITGASSSSGAIALTAVGHNLQNNDIVSIALVGGVPSASGIWVVSVTSTSVFVLNNSVFGGSYTSGGTASHIGFCTAGTPTDN